MRWSILDITKQNSFILILYIYLSSISLLFIPIISNFYVKTFILFLMILATLYVNSFSFPLNIRIIFGGLVVLIIINYLMVPHKQYVFADGINFLLYSFIPVYLFVQRKVSLVGFREYWLKFAIFFTFLMPLYYIYRIKGFILYFDIGFLAHLNILILTYYLLSQNNTKRNLIYYIIYLISNLAILGVLGSRMVLIATLLTIIWTFILLANKKSIKFYISISSLAVTFFFISRYLLEILVFLNTIISEIGVKSRNLSLFITQLKSGFNNSTILSGRDDIYPVVINYLYEHGLFPSGLGMARKLTEGKFYHAHNFLLELLLALGLLGFIFLFGVFIFKLYHLLTAKNNPDIRLTLELLSILLVSFLIRSLTGTYYLTDPIFLISFGIIISIKTRKFNLSFVPFKYK